jgi:hypothetical protein
MHWWFLFFNAPVHGIIDFLGSLFLLRHMCVITYNITSAPIFFVQPRYFLVNVSIGAWYHRFHWCVVVIKELGHYFV